MNYPGTRVGRGTARGQKHLPLLLLLSGASTQVSNDWRLPENPENFGAFRILRSSKRNCVNREDGGEI